MDPIGHCRDAVDLIGLCPGVMEDRQTCVLEGQHLIFVILTGGEGIKENEVCRCIFKNSIWGLKQLAVK